MSYPKFDANTLMKFDEKEIWALPEGRIILSFEDGTVLETTQRRTVISWYFWRMHREFPGTPVNANHHIGNGRFVKGTEIKLASKVLWDVYDGYANVNDNTVWDMSKVVYEILNTIHNVTMTRLSPFVTTVDLSDINGLINHPAIFDIKAQAANDEIDIPEAHARIYAIVTGDSPEMRHNGVAMMARANLLNKNQLVQFIGPRGYVRGTDGLNFSETIDVGYIDGMSTLYDSSTESRSASTALYMNARPLQDAEYFNRQMQLLTAVISTVTKGDCHTPHTLSWLVDKTDLSGLAGKYHMVNGIPVMFNESDTHLIGKVIQLRSITCCVNEDTTTTCSVCLGEMHRILPPKTNLGHILTINPLSAISQLILSTKHVIASMASLYLTINEEVAPWIKYDRQNKSSIHLRKQCASNKYVLRIAQKEIQGLNNITHCDDPSGLSPQRVSAVSEIALAVADREGNRKGDWTYVNTIVGGMGSSLSTDVIMAIKNNGITIVDEHIEIVLTEFKGKELLITPRSNEDMLSYLKTIKHFVFGSEPNGESIVSYTNCGQAVAALKRIFDEKIYVGVIHAEIFVRACMTVDHENNDYRLPLGGEPFKFSAARKIISNRSISAGLAFQGQQALLIKPGTYLQGAKRPDHPLDSLV